MVVYKDENRTVNVIDIPSRKHLLIPNPRPEYPIGPKGTSITLYPSVYKRYVAYSQYFDDSKNFTEIIRADLDKEIQEIL